MVEDLRHGLRLGRDGLVSLAAALVLLLERPDDPELAYAASQREQVLNALDLEIGSVDVMSGREGTTTYEGLGFQLHGHAVVGSLADGDLVVDALGREKDELAVGLENLGDGLTLPVWKDWNVSNVVAARSRSLEAKLLVKVLRQREE